MLKNFAISPLSAWAASGPWGGGHSADTDPTRKGWRVIPQKGNTNLAVLGQAGVPGCASVLFLEGTETLGVGIHSLAPDVISSMYTAAHAGPLTLSKMVVADEYVSIGYIPGWGLEVIALIEKARLPFEG